MPDRVDVFLHKWVGKFPDVMEGLVEVHLKKGDILSALVTAEWYTNATQPFEGWSRPQAFNAHTLIKHGREVGLHATVRPTRRLIGHDAV